MQSCVQEIAKLPGVQYVECDQCAYGLWWEDELGAAAVKKPTGWLTNSPEIAKELCKKCPGCERHCKTIGIGKQGMRAIERYPPAQVTAVLRGLKREAVKLHWMGSLEAGPHIDEPEPWDAHPEYYSRIVDNISGDPLDAKLVSDARKEEMQFLDQLGAYVLASKKVCRAETDKDPVPTVWVDVNKGDDDRPAVRSRLCVAETRSRTTLDLGDPS